jgi:L-2-hydroxyglutarate oxidase
VARDPDFAGRPSGPRWAANARRAAYSTRNGRRTQDAGKGDIVVDYDFIVVGGGIVGAATAWQLTQAQPDATLLLLEKEPAFATHQTGHNSGVIHSGIYYEPGSLKAELCRRGSSVTKQFARAHGIPVREVGKLLVATTAEERARMSQLLERARINGIEAELVDAHRLRRMEPNVVGLEALWVPEAAVTDYGAITGALLDEVRASGGQTWRGAEVTGIQESDRAVVIRSSKGDVEARAAVFCAGLQADRVARMAGLATDFSIVPFRGEYYDVTASKTSLVQRLIYPVPDPALPFLGVHLTPTATGGLTVGPNAVLGLAREGYPKRSVHWADVRDMVAFPGTWRVAKANVGTGLRELRNSVWKRSYLRECRKYCPSLTLEDIEPREAGIRAQAVLRDGTLVHDFLLRRTRRTLHVINAPSPAATSALPIGERLASAALELDEVA